MAAGPEGVDGLAGWVMAWQLARRQAWSVSLFDLEAVSSFSNRGHERKRFFPPFLSSLLCRFLLFDRAAGFLPPRP